VLALPALLLAGCPGEDEVQPPPPPPPAPSPTPQLVPDALGAEAVLERVVQQRCLLPGAEPWALMHGLLVEGAEARLADGRLAVDQLVEDNLCRVGEGWGFPHQDAEGRLVEPHPGSFLKTLLELDVPRERVFTTPSGPITLGELVDQQTTRWLEEGPGGGRLPFHNEGWLLELIAGAPDAHDVRGRALEVLVENQAYLEAYREDPTRRYSKPWEEHEGRRQAAHIHRYFCGGTHLFQGIQRAHGAELPPALARQYELLLLRLEREPRYWEEVRGSLAGRPPAERAQHLRVIRAQELKIIGHALETYLRAVHAGALPPLSEQGTQAITQGFALLDEVVLAIEELGLYGDLDQLRDQERQLFLDLVGDSAHALHAYRLWRALRGAPELRDP
jgi:hypothetical protein